MSMPRPSRRLTVARWALGLLGCLVTGLVLAGGQARPWTVSMDERVVLQAARLMPRSLRWILRKHREALLAGAAHRGGPEDNPEHTLRPGQQGSSAATRIDEIAASIVEMMNAQRPFADIVRRMGTLGHFVGDLNNPLHVAGEDARQRTYRRDYAAYVESNLNRFPLVFYGWKDAALDSAAVPEGGRVAAFAASASRRTRRYYEPISRAYDPKNPAPMRERFDVRSLPFGIGSLCYSHTVTDTARLWLYIWKRANGDLRDTPYMKDQTRRPVTGPEGGKR